MKLQKRNMKITLEVNDELITMELYDEITIWDMIEKFKILLTFCGYTQNTINKVLKEQE